MAVPKLFSAFALGQLDLPNRIVVSPMCQYSAVDGIPGAWHRQHLGSLAVSGAGLVILEATAVEPAGRISAGDLGLWNDGQEAALTALVADMKAVGGHVVGIQLAHAGRKASAAPPWLGGGPLAPEAGAWPVVSASPLAFAEGWPEPRALAGEDIDRLRQAFADSARRAFRAGIDVIELHAAHGYLLHQFLSPLSNQRSDCYGGSAENRRRLLLEIAAEVLALRPDGKAVGMRITGTDWHPQGLGNEELLELARELRRLGIDYVAVSSGGIVPGLKIPVEPGYQLPFAERVKKTFPDLTVMAVGMILTPHQAEAILAEGRADLIALARPFLDNPRWPWHAAEALGAPRLQPVQYERSAAELWRGAEAARRGLLPL